MTKPVIISWHAGRAMAARDISRTEVLDLLTNYRNRWSAFQHRGRPTPNRYVYQGDELAVVVQETPTNHLVITVLLKEQRQWNDEDARNRRRTADRSPG